MQVTVHVNKGIIAKHVEWCGDVMISGEGVRKEEQGDTAVSVDGRQFGFMMHSEYSEKEITNPSTDSADIADMEDIELCHFIHPSVTDDRERMQIHKEIENLVRCNTIPNICSYLNQMASDSRILLPIEPISALKELRRMGMPGEDTEGFKYKNFSKYYRK